MHTMCHKARRIRTWYRGNMLTLCFRDNDASLCVHDSRDELPLERPNLVQLRCIKRSGQKAACGRSGKNVDESAGRSSLTRCSLVSFGPAIVRERQERGGTLMEALGEAQGTWQARKVCSGNRSRETREGKNVDGSAGRSPTTHGRLGRLAQRVVRGRQESPTTLLQ
jgi:hypothetical protein